tara:strand:- start:1319 stop:3001 length:1683 start_codon:yes stop_codon:yes gene_type:complete
MMLNEKLSNAYTIEGVSKNIKTNLVNDDLGLIALDSQIIGSRGNSKHSSLKDCDLEILFDIIIQNIDNLDCNNKKTEYMSYFIKLIFKIRDITEGNGEQDIFYKLIMMLNKKNNLITTELLPFLTGGYDRNGDRVKMMPYGSFKDLNNLYKLCVIDKSVENDYLKNSILSYIKYTLLIDSKADYPTLCVKWVPREKKSVDQISNMTTDISKKLFGEYLPKNKLLENYRKLLSPISQKIKILETLMAENRWDEITVKDIPSKAFLKYIKALKFENKDGSLRDNISIDRLELRNRILLEQKKALTNPESSRINTSTLLPHEIVQKLLNYNVIQQDIDSYNSMWAKYSSDFKKKLGEGNLQPGVILADVSGSMSGLPMNVCIALSILLSDLFEGPFKNKVLTFETDSKWHNIVGETLYDKVKCLEKASWGGTTNFKNALKKILDVGVKTKLKDSDMPKILYVFSDMQWNEADKDKTGFESIESMYTTYGYKMPHIVFWNLRTTNTFNNNSNQKNTTMMSGFSPNLFKQFINGNFIETTPWTSLKDLLDSNRYSQLDEIIKNYF